MNESSPLINYERLFKLRLVVARHGEMDAGRWWNTQGILGRRGAVVFKRGFPSTYRFAQARVAFEVARTRCRELYNPPGCMTLWTLPSEVEEQFEEHWQTWLDDNEKWAAIFQTVEAQTGDDLLLALGALDLLSSAHTEAIAKLRRSAENRAVVISGNHRPNDDVITLLAAGFSRGETGIPAIPYAKLEA